MAFFKKIQQHINKKWYPRSVLVGSPIGTEQVAKRLAAESTVAPADVMAVLQALSGVMGDYMAQGRSVKLDGIGTFHFAITASGKGVDTPEEVSVNQISGVKVRFIPETTYRRAGGGRVATRALTDVNIEWIDIDSIDKEPAKKPATGDGEDPDTGNTGDGGLNE